MASESFVKQVVTVHGINVDSICHTIWDSHKAGVKDIIANDRGVRVTWNQGSTFVPWSNVRYVKE